MRIYYYYLYFIVYIICCSLFKLIYFYISIPILAFYLSFRCAALATFTLEPQRALCSTPSLSLSFLVVCSVYYTNCGI